MVEPGLMVRRARPLLGTRVEIGVAADPPNSRGEEGSTARSLSLDELHQAIDAAFAAIDTVHRAMSYHDAGSELTRLNTSAACAPQAVGEHTHAVLSAALEFARRSGGAFDPCIAPLLEDWGYLPPVGLPCTEAPGAWRDVELLPERRVRFHRPLRLDLGGIAKGYAVDRAVRVLCRAGISEAIVNAGGDLRVVGTHSVQLRHPDHPGMMGHGLEISGAAMATSAGYFSGKRAGGREVSALIDPVRMSPQTGNLSVSVTAADCMTADALTKVVMFAPAAVAERMLEEYAAQAFLLQGAGAAPQRQAGAPAQGFVLEGAAPAARPSCGKEAGIRRGIIALSRNCNTPRR